MKFKDESVKSLFIEMQFNGAKLSSGTGFLIQKPRSNDYYLITNRHNVTGLDQNTGKPLSCTGGIPNEIVIHHRQLIENEKYNPLDEGTHQDRFTSVNTIHRIEKLYKDEYMEFPRWKEHPVHKEKADFIALKLENLHHIRPYPYNLYERFQTIDGGSWTDLDVGPADTVSVIGFPFGIVVSEYFAIWATGFVASDILMDFNNLPIFLIDCRTRQGQSGSPVLAYRAARSFCLMENGSSMIFDNNIYRFMGIYSGRINANSDIGIVWKTSAIIELVNSL